MKLGFDLDGVILRQSPVILRLIHQIEDPDKRREAYHYYYLNPEIQLDPLMFLGEEDELYFITARNKLYEEVTKSFIKKHYPNSKLVILNHINPVLGTDLEGWYLRQAELKAKVINELGLDVYFEDCRRVIKHLRRLCPGTKILVYGENYE